MANSRIRPFDYWATCRACRDQFSLVIWCYPDPKVEDGWVGRVEKSRDLQLDQGHPRHRCGGELSIYGEQRRVRLVE